MIKNRLCIWPWLLLNTLSSVAMEDNRGKKRPIEQIQSVNQRPQSVKKAKGDDSEGQEYIIFKTFDNKEIRILKSHVNVSPTLQRIIEDIQEPLDTSKPIPFPSNENFTKKRIKKIKKILNLIFKNEVNQEDEAFLNFLSESGTEQDAIKNIITYLDLDEELHNLLNRQSFKLKTIDNNTLIVSPDVLLLHEYFRNVLNAGLRESVSREIETNMSTKDLELIIDLLTDPYTIQLAKLRFSLDSIKNRESLEKAESLLVKYIAQEIGNKYNDEYNDLMAIISQAHQWELWFIVKACISFYYENANTIDEIYSFIKNLPADYYPYCFALELINDKNVNFLFNACLQLFIEEINKEQEFLKENDNYDKFNTLIAFLPCFRSFERFMSLNEYLIPSIMKYSNDQIEYILFNYKDYHSLKENNKEVFEALEEILKKFLIQKLINSALPRTELPKITRFFDQGWYLLTHIESLPHGCNLIVGNLINGLTWRAGNVPCNNDDNNFLYGNLFFYISERNNGELFEYNLNTGKTVKVMGVENQHLIGITEKDFIFLDQTTNVLTIKSRFDKKQLSIPISEPHYYNYTVLVLNDETIIVKHRFTIKLITYSLEDQTFNENIVADELFVQNEINAFGGGTSVVMSKINDNLFAIGYPNETLILVHENGSYEIIKTKQLPSESNQYIPDYHLRINNIFPCFNNRNFAVSYALGTKEGYFFYEVWDILSRKKIYTSSVSSYLLVHAYDGKFIFSDRSNKVYFEQLSPIIASFEQLMDHYKKIN